MTFQLGNISLLDKKIDSSLLKPDFMPGFQKEKECYKKAVILKGTDIITGRTIKEPTTWPRDSTQGELAYENFVKTSTDDKMNWHHARDINWR